MTFIKNLVGLTLLLVTTYAQAGIITVYGNAASFIADTGAVSLTGAIPNTGNQGATTTLGDVTFDTTGYPASGSIDFGSRNWSTLIPGHEIAISGTESMDVSINLASSVTAFGFVFHEPSNINQVTDGTNTPQFYDSPFTISLFDGGALVDSIAFNPANDQLLFFGVTTDMAFDSVSIVETLAGQTYGGGIDISNDNEFFGEFYAAVQVPEPSSLALLIFGLVGLGCARRFRS